MKKTIIKTLFACILLVSVFSLVAIHSLAGNTWSYWVDYAPNDIVCDQARAALELITVDANTFNYAVVYVATNISGALSSRAYTESPVCGNYYGIWLDVEYPSDTLPIAYYYGAHLSEK